MKSIVKIFVLYLENSTQNRKYTKEGKQNRELTVLDLIL